MLFGLGLGLVLASLAVLFQPEPGLGEEEIIQQARELGMVFREEVVVFSSEEAPGDTGGPGREGEDGGTVTVGEPGEDQAFPGPGEGEGGPRGEPGNGGDGELLEYPGGGEEGTVPGPGPGEEGARDLHPGGEGDGVREDSQEEEGQP